MDPEKRQEPTKEMALDSEDMDPHEVLFGDEVAVRIPVPEAKVFNNLAEYYSKTFPKKNEKSKLDIAKQQQERLLAESGSRFANMPIQESASEEGKRSRVSRRPALNVIDKMHLAKGPLCILYASINKQIKILIRRRKACILRDERFSWVDGTLVAFDKHCNLALSDVVEEFKHRTKVCSQVRDILIRKRSKQMLIRGDNVVLAASCP